MKTYTVPTCLNTNEPTDWEKPIRDGSRWAFEALLDRCLQNELNVTEWGSGVEEMLIEHQRWRWLMALADHPAGWDKKAPHHTTWHVVAHGIQAAPRTTRQAWVPRLTRWLESFPTADDSDEVRHIDASLRLACWSAGAEEWHAATLDSIPASHINLPMGTSDRSPLIWAVVLGQPLLVEKLLARGASPAWKDPVGATALHLRGEFFSRQLRRRWGEGPRLSAHEAMDRFEAIGALLLSSTPTIGQDWQSRLPEQCDREILATVAKAASSPEEHRWVDEVTLRYEIKAQAPALRKIRI